MNISKINLNLLLSFDALLAERNVTKAGEKLFITQSAMSNALNQLREIFQDELFIRGGTSMVPTQKALELQPHIAQFVRSTKQIFEAGESFDPATSERVFKLGMSDIMEFSLLPYIIERIQRQAPHVQLQIEHMNSLEDEVPFLYHNVELGITISLNMHSALNHDCLFTVAGVVVARKNHPLLQHHDITLDQFLAAKHIRVQYLKDWHYTNVDKTLKKMGYKRHVVLNMPHVFPAFAALQRSDLICTMPDLLSQDLAKKFNIKTQPLPFEVPKVHIVQGWHKQNENDAGLIWLRQVIKQIVADHILTCCKSALTT